MDEQEIVDRAEELCKRLAKAMGWEIVGGTFREHRHGGIRLCPRRAAVWRLAEIAFDELHGTPIDDAADNVEADAEEARIESIPVFAGDGV